MSNPDSLDLWYKQGTFNYLRLYGSDRQNPISGFLYDDNGSVVTFQGYLLPTADGSANQVIITDGSGTLSWSNQSGGGSGVSYYGTSTISVNAGTLSISVISGGVDHDLLLNFDATEHFTEGSIDHANIVGNDGVIHVDWSTSSLENIHADNYTDTNTTYTAEPTIDITNDAISVVSAEVDHDQLLNTHDLTTDIDHDTITNNHNLTTDIDHGSISGLDDNDHGAIYYTEAEVNTKITDLEILAIAYATAL